MKRIAAVMLCLAPAPLAAQSTQPTQAQRPRLPAAFTRAIECRTIAQPQERLACYDREVAAMAAAEASSEIRVVDRQEIRRTRTSLFGLTLPDLNIFGGDTEDPMNEINGRIRTATQLSDGKWAFVLEDGARWVQIDSREFSSYPRAGHPVRIRRASMGSFLANVNRQVAVRVRRSN
jgi:hypothetical protein